MSSIKASKDHLKSNVRPLKRRIVDNGDGESNNSTRDPKLPMCYAPLRKRKVSRIFNRDIDGKIIISDLTPKRFGKLSICRLNFNESDEEDNAIDELLKWPELSPKCNAPNGCHNIKKDVIESNSTPVRRPKLRKENPFKLKKESPKNLRRSPRFFQKSPKNIYNLRSSTPSYLNACDCKMQSPKQRHIEKNITGFQRHISSVI